MSEPPANPWPRRVLLALHLLWALIGLTVCLWLAAAGGHPPGLVFVPLAVAAWALGHLFLWAAGRLARAGAVRPGGERWPPALLAAVLGSGCVTAIGLCVLALQAIQRELAPDAWTLTLAAVWSPHVVAFAALLLRRRWARPLAVALALFWVAVLIYQLFTTTQVRAWEWPVAALLLAALLALAVALWRSAAVRRALA